MPASKKLVPDTTPEADIVMTPPQLARDIVAHFNPTGVALEPCRGRGAFERALRAWGCTVRTCELSEGRDFFDFRSKVDWIVTNPPWSKTRDFLKHSYEVADNIVFLITINHILCLKARLRDMKEAGFCIKEVLLCDTPAENWPQSGFQLGAVLLTRGEQKEIKWSCLEERE